MRLEDFLELDWRELDFFALEARVLFFALLLRVLFLALLRDERERDDLPLELLDFFLAAFFVAITILLGGLMARSLRQVASGFARKVASGCTRECMCCYTIRRIRGMRTSGSAMSHVTTQLSMPVMRNLRIAGATNG